MIAHTRLAWLLAAVFTGGAAAAVAQEAPQGDPATELGVVFGSAMTGGDAAGAIGAMAGFRLAPWASLEARGTWMGDAGVLEQHRFAADVGLITSLASTRALKPFAGAAFGLYQSKHREAAVFATDPALRLTGGVQLFTHRNLVVRPEASVVVVRGGNRDDTLVLVGLQFGYRFEDRPVTPARRGR